MVRIGELADEAGVSADTIRYYEAQGLLAPPARTGGGYRDYGPDALGDLQFIKKAQASGLKLEHIREVMEIAAGGLQPCDHVRAVVSARLAEVDARLREQRALRATLRATLARLDEASRPAAGCRCSAIESA